MGLFIKLKPGEKLLIEGKATIINGEGRAQFLVESDGAILRERDLLKEDDADTLCKKFHFHIQSMFLEGEKDGDREKFIEMVREIQNRIPESGALLARINEMVTKGSYYLALKDIRELIKHERKMIDY